LKKISVSITLLLGWHENITDIYQWYIPL